MIKNKTRMSPLSLLFNIIFEVLSIAIREEEEIRGIQIGKEEVKLYSLQMTSHYTWKTLKMLSEKYYSSSDLVNLQDTKLKHRNHLHSYTLTMKDQKEKFKKQLHLPSPSKMINCLGKNLPKETKGLYLENYKELMKDIKYDRNTWKDVTCYWIGRINCQK